MTKRERAQVVELLRCAADWFGGRLTPIYLTADVLGIKHSEVHHYAVHAYGDVVDWPFDGVARLLEAAQRVEEGSWPEGAANGKAGCP